MATRKVLALVCATVLTIGSVCPSEDISNIISAVYTKLKKEMKEEKPESLMKKYPKAFYLRNVCFLKTYGDPDATHVSFLNQGLAEVISYDLAKDPRRYESGFKHLQDRGAWKTTDKKTGGEIPGLCVHKVERRVFDAGIKFVSKFVGCRDTLIGRILEALFFLRKRYKGNFLRDEHKLYPLWSVILNDKEEVKEFLDYLSYQNMKDMGIPGFDHKPILYLTLINGELTEEDKNYLESMFILVDPDDRETIEFFMDAQKDVAKIVADFESKKPAYPGESLLEKAMRKAETECKKFDVKDMVTITVVGLTAAVLLANIGGATDHLKAMLNFVPAKDQNVKDVYTYNNTYFKAWLQHIKNLFSRGEDRQ